MLLGFGFTRHLGSLLTDVGVVTIHSVHDEGVSVRQFSGLKELNLILIHAISLTFCTISSS